MDQMIETRATWYRRLRLVVAVLAVGCAVLTGAACGTSEAPSPEAPTVTLPPSFPAAQVPLVEGNLIDAGERSQDGITVFNVTVQASAGGFDRAKKALTDAGYQALGDGPEGESRSAQFTGKGYVVTVSTVEGSAIPNAVFYAVSKG